MADLVDQVRRDHNDTLEHQHLALTEIHHLAGHDQLFDTIFVYENYPSTPPRCWPRTILRSPTSPAGSTTTTRYR